MKSSVPDYSPLGPVASLPDSCACLAHMLEQAKAQLKQAKAQLKQAAETWNNQSRDLAAALAVNEVIREECERLVAIEQEAVKVINEWSAGRIAPTLMQLARAVLSHAPQESSDE